MRLRVALLLLIGVWLLSSPACQAAWTLPEGDSQLIVHAERYAADGYFDQGRTARSLGSNGEYTKESLSLYGEYGLRDRWMLFANLPLEHASYADDSPFSVSGSSPGDFEFGLRHRLSRADVAYAWSWQVSVKAPLYGSSQQPEPGNHQVDVDLRVPWGYGWGTAARGGYVVVYPGVRLRAGAPTDEARLDVSVGLRPSARWLFEFTAFELHSLQSSDTTLTSFGTNPTQGIDFDRTRLQLQSVYWITTRAGVLIGGYRDVAGRNIGRGTGFFGGVWIKM